MVLFVVGVVGGVGVVVGSGVVGVVVVVVVSDTVVFVCLFRCSRW